MISSGSIVSPGLAREMEKEPTQEALVRYLSVPFQAWNIEYLLSIWYAIYREKISCESALVLEREGARIQLTDVFDELVIALSAIQEGTVVSIEEHNNTFGIEDEDL